MKDGVYECCGYSRGKIMKYIRTTMAILVILKSSINVSMKTNVEHFYSFIL